MDFLPGVFARGVCCAALLCALHAQEPSALPDVPLAEGSRLLTAQRPQVWAVAAGKNALGSGLPALAQKFLTEALADEQLQGDERVNAALDLSAAQLNLREYDNALKTLDSWVPKDNARGALRRAFVLYQQQRARQAAGLLERHPAEQLPQNERAWWHLVRGLVYESAGDGAKAEASFLTALENAQDSADKALFETAISRGKIISGKADPKIVDTLRAKLEESRNTPLERQLAKELAVALVQTGKKQEALELLDAQMTTTGQDEREVKNQLRLLYALIDDDNSPKAMQMLKEVLGGKGERAVQRAALYTLARAPQWQLESEGFLELLTDVFSKTPDHELADEILLLLAQLNLNKGSLEDARKAATRLLDEFSSPLQRAQALRLLAIVAMRETPARYRVAADYLNRLRAEVTQDDQKVRLSLLCADLYFLNGDYSNANTLYSELVRIENPPLPRGELLFREVLSAVRADKLDTALSQLDGARSLGDIDAENYWRAQWSFLRALQDKGKAKEAFEHLRGLLEKDSGSRLSAPLRLRLLWTESQLAMATGRTQEASQLAERLILMVDSLPKEALDQPQRERILSNALLLRAQALLDDANPKEADVAFARLRKDYPGSEACVLSYFVQARQLAGEGALAKAQQQVLTVPEKYPESQYAPAALYEAAVLSDGQGTRPAYEAAVRLLDRLARDYPDSRYVFFARLRQGDIARKLNDFAAALTAYENLLSAYPEHPERPRAEMARADAYLALSSKDPARLGAAEAAFERLFALPGLSADMRVEAGFKWGFVLEKAGNLTDARQAYWLVVSRFLRDEKAPELSGAGRYWMSRTLLQLGDLFAQQGDLQQARTAYALIVQYALPGANLARGRMAAPPKTGEETIAPAAEDVPAPPPEQPKQSEQPTT